MKRDIDFTKLTKVSAEPNITIVEILDDMDTASDIFKDDDKAYYNYIKSQVDRYKSLNIINFNELGTIILEIEYLMNNIDIFNPKDRKAIYESLEKRWNYIASDGYYVYYK